MGTRKVELGEVGHTVKAQVRRLREQRGLSLQALSERLQTVGRPILPSGLSKIEAGDRRVDVDDLVALAEALGTVPDDLLTPNAAPKGVEPAEALLRVAAELTATAEVLRLAVTDSAGLTDAAVATFSNGY